MRKIVSLFAFSFLLLLVKGFSQVGTPTFYNAVPSTASNGFPLSTTTSNKVQWIYAPGAFTTTGTAAGIALSSGNLISKLYIRIQTVNANTIYQPDFSISMLQTGTSNTFSDGNYLTGLTTVFQSNSFQFTGITAGSWYGITLTTPFAYDPAQSLIVELKSNLNTSGGNSVNSITTSTLNQRIFGAYASATGTAGTGLTPIGFDVIPASACTAPPVAGTPTSSVTNVCSGTNFNLGLTGNSTGTGQTYQWQSSPTGTSLWSNVVAASSSAALATSQTATSFYRCIVTCSSVSDTSTSVQVTSPALVSGNFTINNALPTGGGNFQTFAEAISSIACGINGPVTFNVEVGSGPYNEQFTIPQIFGTNATNRVAIRGNGAIIQFDPPTADRHVIKLDGADYITLDSLDIRTTGTTTTSFGWGIHLTNGADYDSIKNCNITIGSLSTTQSNSAGIVVSGSTTSVTTAGSASHNVIVGNTITGGHQGIIITGTATSLNGVKNQIIRNTIKDFYASGIILTHNDSSIISFNDISRPTLAAVTTFAGVQLGAGNIKCVIEGNKIHDTHNAATTQSGIAYGVFSTANDATVGNENRVINNIIYNFNSGSGIIYGLYNAGSDGVRYYHNTVVLDHSAATAGVTRGFFQTTAATNIDFKNNIIYINRGGTGDKHCVYFGTTTSTITSNNNVLYNISSSGTNNGIGSFGTAGSATLALWQAANSGAYDQQSVSVDPLFTDVNLQDYTPTEVAVDNIGANVGVATDINGKARTLTSPDPGAFEVPPSVGLDLLVASLTSPSLSLKSCYNSENVSVSIRNNSVDTINFAINPATVTVTVAGVVNTVYTAVINTGTLAPASALDVTVFTPSSTINMSGIGNYNFSVNVNVVGDVNPANNIITVDIEKLTLTGGTATATPETYCAVGGTPKLTSTDAEGYNSVKWQQSINGGASYTDITNSDTLIYTLQTPIAQNTYFRMVAVCGINEQNSTADSVIINNPQILTSQGATRCGPGSVTLTATANVTADIKWYEASTGGTALFTGASFTTPTVLSTKTYYAAASQGGGSVNTGIANAISTTGNTGYNAIGLMFDATVPFTLQSVAIYPVGTGGSASVTIELRNSANTVLETYTANVTTAPLPGVKTVVPINFNVPVGTAHRLVVNGATGLSSLIRESTVANFTYPYTVPGVMSITSAFTGGAASSAFYYYLYDWQISSGCEGTRTPVTASITSSPSITAATVDSVVCNGVSAALNVTSSNTNYTYSWAPVSQNGASINVSPSETTKYYVNATDAGTNCTAIDSLTVHVQPISTIDANPKDFCLVGGVTTLTLNPLIGYAPNTIQWQSSNNNVTFSDISGATNATYTSPVINATTYFKAVIKNGAGALCSDSVKTILLYNPSIISTTPANRCGTGTVDLSAIANTGSIINWYATPTGGNSVYTGSTFTTPVLSDTTNYYVSASLGGGIANTGKATANSTATSGSGTTNFGLVFNALSEFELKSVVIYAIASAANTSGTVTIEVINGAGTVLHTKIVNVTGNPIASVVGQRVELNFLIQPGTNLKLRHSARSTSITGLLFEPAANAPSGNYGFPYVVPGIVSINTSTLSAAPTNTARNDLYYYFYDWEVVTGCESARILVAANVDTSASCNALPVSLINFAGIKEGAINRLSWTTTTETNNAGFSIERSADGRNFSTLTYVASKAENGNSTNTINYSFNDVRTLSGNNYYRLKQVDKDGRATYSSIVLIKGDKVRAIMITGLYPNPAKSEVKLTIESPSAEKVTVLVTDITGKVVVQTVQSLVIGNNTIQLGVSNLANGSYFVKMICNNGCETGFTKFVKQ